MNTTKISYDRDYSEYRVRLFVDGVYQAGADYFTDDKADAKATAKHMQANGSISDKTTDFAKAEQSAYEAEAEACTLYDVCNDYSLEKSCQTPDLTNYRAITTGNGVYYYDKANGELHYFRGTK